MAMSDFTETRGAAEGTACRTVHARLPEEEEARCECWRINGDEEACAQKPLGRMCTDRTLALVWQIAVNFANAEGKQRLRGGKWRRTEGEGKHRLFTQKAKKEKTD